MQFHGFDAAVDGEGYLFTATKPSYLIGNREACVHFWCDVFRTRVTLIRSIRRKQRIIRRKSGDNIWLNLYTRENFIGIIS